MWVSREQAKLDFAEGVRGFGAIQGLHLENWKKAAFDADALAKMPFLAKYASV
jgi:hypothetical protein